MFLQLALCVDVEQSLQNGSVSQKGAVPPSPATPTWTVADGKPTPPPKYTATVNIVWQKKDQPTDNKDNFYLEYFKIF